jgi:hypothetical protein
MLTQEQQLEAGKRYAEQVFSRLAEEHRGRIAPDAPFWQPIGISGGIDHALRFRLRGNPDPVHISIPGYMLEDAANPNNTTERRNLEEYISVRLRAILA